MSSSLLSIGTQALTANQTALSYTGQNIANVNTEGYSRQRIGFETQEPPLLGVSINEIQRLTDQFLVQQVWRDQAAYSSSEQQAQKIATLDTLMVSESTSISASIDEYFAAMQRAVDDPLFIANRQLFLAEAESLVSSFQNFDQRLRDQQTLMNTEIRSMTTDVNSLTRNIADLNVKIVSLAAGAQNYNTLLDERDQLIKELSQYISVDMISPDGGITANLNLSNGEPLVVAGRSAQLSIRDGSPDPVQVEVYLSRGAVDAKVTDQLGDGALGGVFTYRDDVLQPVISEIGRLAIVLTETMNAQHRKGMDLNGDMGQDLFRSQPRGVASADINNKTKGVSPTVTFYDVTALTASDYEVEMTGVDTFRVYRLSDGKVWESRDLTELADTATADELETSGVFQWIDQTSPAKKTLNLSIDGFTLKLEGAEAPSRGDRFLVQPTKEGARQMGLAITNPRMLALASPVRVEPAETNAGNAEVIDIEIIDASTSSPLRRGTQTFPLEIVFNADGTYSVFDVSDAANPVLYTPTGGTEMENLNYASGSAIDLGTFSVTLKNTPKAGDRFELDFNTDGFSDNRNALAMANLQNMETVNGFSYQDSYGQLLARVGSQASVAATSYSANQAVLNSSEQALSSVSGVNLDEEAAKLIQFQQAYTASTRLISTYQTIFDSLISAVR